MTHQQIIITSHIRYIVVFVLRTCTIPPLSLSMTPSLFNSLVLAEHLPACYFAAVAVAEPSGLNKCRRTTRKTGARRSSWWRYSCSFCRQNIPYSSECVQLQPCGCKACAKCLLNAHTERGRSLLCCPCEESMSCHKFLSSARIPDGRACATYVECFTKEKDSDLQHRYPCD